MDPAATPVIVDLYPPGAYYINCFMVTTDNIVLASAIGTTGHVLLRIDASGTGPPFPITEHEIPPLFQSSQTYPTTFECIRGCQ